MQENKMGILPVKKLLFTMSLPIMISMLVQALYNVVDSMYVARLSEDALTAVSMAFPIQNLMIAFSTGTGVGINALLSKRLGEKNQAEVNKTAINGMFLIILCAGLFLIVGLTMSDMFFGLQTDIESIASMGSMYMRIVCCLSFGSFVEICFERLLQSTGRTMYSMITQALGAIINIILDPILIFGWFNLPAMGVVGAAWATVIGQIAAMFVGFFLNARFNPEVQLKIKGFRPDIKVILRILSVGIPSTIMASIGSVMTFCMNKILIGFSSTAVAVFGVYFKLQSFVFMPCFGLNSGMIPIISYNYGARYPQRIKETIRFALLMAAAIMFIGLMIFQLFPNRLLLLFDASEDMLAIGKPALRIISVSFVFASLSVVYSSVFQAFGKGILSMVVSVTRQLVILLPCAFVLAKTEVLSNVWFAFPIAEIAAVVMCLFFMRKINREIIDKMTETGLQSEG